jgi:hypothetical protein
VLIVVPHGHLNGQQRLTKICHRSDGQPHHLGCHQPIARIVTIAIECIKFVSSTGPLEVVGNSNRRKEAFITAPSQHCQHLQIVPDQIYQRKQEWQQQRQHSKYYLHQMYPRESRIRSGGRN